MKAAPASGGASERVPVPAAPFWSFKFSPLTVCSDLWSLSDILADLG